MAEKPTYEEVEIAVNLLNISKEAGVDKITAELIKKGGGELH